MQIHRAIARAVLVGALGGLCVHANAQSGDDRTPSQPGAPLPRSFEDATVTMRVKTALIRDGEVKARRIRVDTRNGVVELKGSVSNDEMTAALNRVRDVPGVTAVDNKMTVASHDVQAPSATTGASSERKKAR
jgi:osmotically-inducible protein OsmY